MALKTEGSSKAGLGEAEEVGLDKGERARGTGRRQLGCRVAVGVALGTQSFLLLPSPGAGGKCRRQFGAELGLGYV